MVEWSGGGSVVKEGIGEAKGGSVFVVLRDM